MSFDTANVHNNIHTSKYFTNIFAGNNHLQIRLLSHYCPTILRLIALGADSTIPVEATFFAPLGIAKLPSGAFYFDQCKGTIIK